MHVADSSSLHVRPRHTSWLPEAHKDISHLSAKRKFMSSPELDVVKGAAAAGGLAALGATAICNLGILCLCGPILGVFVLGSAVLGGSVASQE